ncbi:hypothetical protein Pyn_25338 [Prunus yedoensis var. nudiflora]|uniref:Uncharacterized protein n=1 Tax=Prunus yedoensis var. nudiflora TaxID=2094558 RepID=A0A314UNU2_PRUYE|nr:hypothetical protein Pyn_25338 [Prunus yedoensis var. nudiflora]
MRGCCILPFSSLCSFDLNGLPEAFLVTKGLLVMWWLSLVYFDQDTELEKGDLRAKIPFFKGKLTTQTEDSSNPLLQYFDTTFLNTNMVTPRRREVGGQIISDKICIGWHHYFECKFMEVLPYSSVQQQLLSMMENPTALSMKSKSKWQMAE